MTTMANTKKKTIAGAMRLTYEHEDEISAMQLTINDSSSKIQGILDGTIPVGEVRDVIVNNRSIVGFDKVASLTLGGGLSFDGSTMKLSSDGLSETTQKDKPMVLQEAMMIPIFERGSLKLIKATELDYSRIRRSGYNLAEGDYLFEEKED